jgi:hypothetical protein
MLLLLGDDTPSASLTGSFYQSEKERPSLGFFIRLRRIQNDNQKNLLEEHSCLKTINLRQLLPK